MADAEQVKAEIRRLSGLADDKLMEQVVGYVTGGTGRRIPRDVQHAALTSPRLAPRVLDALELAAQRAKFFNPKRDDESKREQQARIAPWREKIKAAMPPFQDIVDDLAHEHAKALAALRDDAFIDRFTGFILGEPVPKPTSPRVEALAFRSHKVAARADKVCRLMLEEPAQFLAEPAPGESRTARDARLENFRQRVRIEMKFLRYGVQYAEARKGLMPSEPNHRLQALKLLGKEHPEELLTLLREVRAQARADKEQARQDQRAVRRAARPAVR
ncbi:hypothetical protein HHL19_35305 [Streptomyces sp. R302]|uniref:hypothetical protein n=1 Tax=unclassified Streptomyces TaxID=2593676 RepID=UPI00145F51E1|nr:MULTISPECIES: hypothetical protein [unclassified Streptomyces]NML55190.1 hypothetical protein [Streptomyces sp. R301]NML83780.1 hypothetical protein [Streptomyces sp. R302]